MNHAYTVTVLTPAIVATSFTETPFLMQARPILTPIFLPSAALFFSTREMVYPIILFFH
jgi:hypothetical protein